jgi:arginine/lysine/ornithine decarboxylase
MTSLADDEAGFARLREAVLQLDREAGQIQDRGREQELASGNDAAGQSQMPRPEQILPSWQAVRMKKENKRQAEAAGRIAAGYIYLYPPGIPLLVPGERISEETLARIFAWRRAGLEITGICQEGPGAEEITLQTVIEGEHV